MLGDWSRAGLKVVGAVEGRDNDGGGMRSLRRALDAVPPSGTATLQPASRTLLFDERLLHPAFQPPGAWGYGNVAYGGPSVILGRTYARQLRAIGGTVVGAARPRRPAGFPPIPSAVPLPGPEPLPAAPLPLP